MIYIDPNEFKNHPEIVNKFEEYTVRNQNVDYIISDVLLEVKWSWDDFYASVLDKRIWKQASYLSDGRGLFIVINQSGYYFKKNYAKNLAVCESTILSLLIDWRIPVLILESEGAFYAYLKKIVAKLSKEKKHKIYADFKKIGSSDIDRHIGALAQIESISVTKATLLFEKFGSLENIMSQNPADFAEIKGFGKKLSNKIWDFFRWKWKK